MSDENAATGQYLYAAGDAETRDWFHKQWDIWPNRADPKLTTNLSLHAGGVLAYRIEHDGKDPPMSDQFRGNFDVWERLNSAAIAAAKGGRDAG